MKFSVLVFSVLATVSSASAFECPAGKEGHLTAVSWSAAPRDNDALIRVGIRNTFDKAIRMVDGAVWFVDPLGRMASDLGLGLDPDFQLAASGGNIATFQIKGFDRLIDAAPQDFEAHVCVSSLLFEDGSKAEF